MCKFVSLLCNRYNPNNGKCIDCIIGHIMIDDECVQPALGQDKECLKYNKSAFCEECVSGYKLV